MAGLLLRFLPPRDPRRRFCAGVAPLPVSMKNPFPRRAEQRAMLGRWQPLRRHHPNDREDLFVL